MCASKKVPAVKSNLREDGTVSSELLALVVPLTRVRIFITVLGLMLGLALTILLCLFVGSAHVSPADVLSRMTSPWRAFRGTTPYAADIDVILFSIRLPRLLLAAMVGAALATAGAAFQALLRNPLADPYVLGVSSGASFGAILATMGSSLIGLSSWQAAANLTRPVAAFLGALMAIGLVYVVAGGRRGRSSSRLLLAGVIMSSLLMSVNILLLTTTRQMEIRGFFFWLIGDLSHPVRLDLSMAVVLVVVVMGALAIYSLARSLNLIAVGEEDARTLGVPVESVRTTIYLVTSLMTGAVVSISGSIPYVGLIIPHIVRLSIGGDYRLLLPAVFFAGAIFTVVADTLARIVISPAELPVGVITALCGAPVFLSLLRKRGT
ncbi:MAG: iron ABC transporter permease [Acidobacteria bacterium]|nr:iron ABC transporter permease [Acidobacteriota bacterium]MBI3655720.1 iron ABC transporter permease [Acidobacteriota bacterium]